MERDISERHGPNARKTNVKWSWARHTNRFKKDRWTLRVTIWTPYDKKDQGDQSSGGVTADTTWTNAGGTRSGRRQDRLTWTRHAEAFAQQRDTITAVHRDDDECIVVVTFSAVALYMEQSGETTVIEEYLNYYHWTLCV